MIRGSSMLHPTRWKVLKVIYNNFPQDAGSLGHAVRSVRQFRGHNSLINLNYIPDSQPQPQTYSQHSTHKLQILKDLHPIIITQAWNKSEKV